jgi:hypothetical protein
MESPESLMSPIDLTLPFVPDHVTPLYKTDVFGTLTEPQKLRYNQLFGLYLNEQTAFFEEHLADTVLTALYSKPEKTGAQLAKDLQQFKAEETIHTRMFREFNLSADPVRFGIASRHYHFIKIPYSLSAISRWCASRPVLFSFWIWIMLIQEEISLSFGSECVRWQGVLEPSFLEIQRRHLADEVDHIRWDIELIDKIWATSPMWLRLVMREFLLIPKRGSRAVIETLLIDCPELEPRRPELLAALLSLRTNPDYLCSIYSRENVPRAFGLFDHYPEMHCLSDVFPGYEFHPTTVHA